MTCRIPTIRLPGARLLLPGLALALTTAPALAGDEDLLGAQVPPNVVLFVDSSGSMNSVMTHPSFIATDHPDDASSWGTGLPNNCDILPTGTTGTNDYFDDENFDHTRMQCSSSGCSFRINSYTDDWVATSSSSDNPLNGYVERTYCGKTRKLYTDGSAQDDGNRTIYYEPYLEWLFSLDESDSSTLWGPPEHRRTAQQILDEIDDAANGQNYITGATFPQFQRTRIAAARDIANQVVYQVNSDCPAFGGDCGVYQDRVRFGIGRFDGSDGGYVATEVDAYSNNKSAIESTISSIEGDGSTPLAESLFKIYTYFMSRASDDTKRPLGQDGTTRFPRYQYDTAGTWQTTSSYWTDDPVLQECQKNFVVMVTDGEPNGDSFAGTDPNNAGFSSFDSLIGDYFADSVGDPDIGTDSTPEVGSPPWSSSSGSGYLDDVAHFMQTHDLRPNDTSFPGDQFVDTYTVGFTTSGPVNALLRKTADNGNGLYFEGSQAADLTEALVTSIRDIFSKSQGFAAAAVPAARTSGGGQLYTTIFLPQASSAFWPGLIRSYTITSAGDILDANGDCALQGSSDPADCKSGNFKSTAVAPPHWDAAEAMPDAGSRNLYTSLISSGQTVRSDFDLALTAADLDVSLSDAGDYASSATALTTDALVADAVIAHAAGCQLGTGLSSGFSDCVHRQEVVGASTEKRRLGDIFHSNPIIVGPPSSYVNEPSYRQFQSQSGIATRQRLLYAGANDGFLHAFDAGSWDSVNGVYTEGSGAEVFAFMPWQARKRIKELAVDSGIHPFYVDGSPAVADVWFDADSDETNAKTAAGWHTVLVNGMRGGGSQYFALDVTNPAASGFPGLLWEFPAENDTSTLASYVGETWSDPVITRIRVRTVSNNVVERWVVIVGLGYHETGDPHDSDYDAAALAGRGIAVLDAETGTPIAVRKFGSGTGDVSDMLYAIPSTPGVIDYDQDGFADLLYVGDLGGNVWKWVIDDPASLNSSDLHQPDWEFRKFFDADPGATSSTHRRSFYYAPRATKWSNKLYLGFGSGERNDLLCDSSTGCDEANRFYVVTDRDPWDAGTVSTIDGREYTTGDLTDVTSYEDSCPTVEPAGYFFELPDGAKFTTNSVVFDGFFFVTAFDPAGSTVCDPSGSSNLYGFLVQCGQGFFGNESTLSPIANDSRAQSLGGGFSTDPRISIAPGEGGNRLIVSKQDGEIFNWETGGGAGEHGTLYWRELRE